MEGCTVKGITIFIFLCLISGALWAGDEDINPSIYQQFDPETGYLVKADPQAVGQHAVAPTQGKNVGTSELELVPSESAENAWGPSNYLMIGGIAVISLLAVVFVLKRQRL